MDRLRSKRLKQTLARLFQRGTSFGQLVPSQRHNYRYPLVNVYSLLLTMTIEIMRFPRLKMVIFHSYVSLPVYQRVVAVTTQVLHLDQAFADTNLRLDSIHCPLPHPKVHRLGWSDVWLIALLLRFVFGAIRSDSKKNSKHLEHHARYVFFGIIHDQSWNSW